MLNFAADEWEACGVSKKYLPSEYPESRSCETLKFVRMLAIFKREITSFFASPIAYLVVGLFLLFNGLFLWVFRDGFNIMDYGFADLSNFFLLSPWVFLFLIPAITMKSFAEERKLGTIELLFIKPLSMWQIAMGKFLAALVLAVIALLPTLLYAYTIQELVAPEGRLDMGMTLGSYLGLLFLIANYIAIGIFTSSVTDNQIVAFISGLVLCFVFYYGFEALSTLFGDGGMVLFIRQLGMKSRVDSIARGVLDSRDIIYFLSLAGLFLYMATIQLKSLRFR
jgi:ABC-2 type transport system permease protein